MNKKDVVEIGHKNALFVVILTSLNVIIVVYLLAINAKGKLAFMWWLNLQIVKKAIWLTLIDTRKGIELRCVPKKYNSE